MQTDGNPIAYTFCPACRTVFSLRDAQPQTAENVRCGACDADFSIVGKTYAALADLRSALVTHNVTIGARADDAWSATMTTQAPAARSNMTQVSDVPIPEALWDDFAEAPARQWDWRWVSATLLVVVLVIAFSAQAIYFNRHAIANSPHWRPWLETICTAMRCNLPPRARPDLIELVHLSIQAHPERSGALLVQVIAASLSSQAIAYPVIELKFFDLSGYARAGRRFSPGEYLPKNVKPSRGLAAEQTLQVELEIIDPGLEAVSYQLEFR